MVVVVIEGVWDRIERDGKASEREAGMKLGSALCRRDRGLTSNHDRSG